MRETLFGLSLALLALGFAGPTSASGALSAGTPVASDPAGPADKIFFGGPVLTMKMKEGSKDGMVVARAVAVRKGMIVAVGDEKSVRNGWEGPSTESIDLHGHALLPGFVEPHTHLTLTVQSQPGFSVDCGSQKPDWPVTKVYDLLTQELTKVLAKKLPQDKSWVVGTGFDPSRSKPLFASMTAHDLDENVTAKIPVFVLNASGHIAYVNTAALKLAGITGTTTNPPGVVMEKFMGTDRPTGQLNEIAAINLVSKLIPVPSEKAIQDEAVKVIGQWAAAGVTTSTEIALGVASSMNADWQLYQNLADEPNKLLRFRVYLDYHQVTPVNPKDPKDRRLQIRDNPSIVFEPNQGNDWLKVLGVKFVTDGSTQGFTAFLNQPYLDPAPSGNPPPWYGTSNFPPSDPAHPTQPALTEVMRPFYERGWQLAAHANGDAALDQVLDAYQEISKGDPNRRERRLRIEHFTVTPPEHLGKILDRVVELGATPGMTAGHLYFWGQVFDEKILGAERARKIHPSQSLTDRHIRFAYHSDSPVTKVEPLRYVQTEVTREPQWVARPEHPDHPFILGADERITVDEALRAVTLDAAYQDFFDDKVGSLEVGKLADFVVLECNPRAVEPSTIADIKVLATYLEGKIAYQLPQPTHPKPDSCHPIAAAR